MDFLKRLEITPNDIATEVENVVKQIIKKYNSLASDEIIEEAWKIIMQRLNDIVW